MAVKTDVSFLTEDDRKKKKKKSNPIQSDHNGTERPVGHIIFL